MMADTSFDTESRRSRMTARQSRLFSHTAIAALALVLLGAIVLYPMVVVLWGLFAP